MVEVETVVEEEKIWTIVEVVKAVVVVEITGKMQVWMRGESGSSGSWQTISNVRPNKFQR